MQQQLAFRNHWWCEIAATGGVFYLQQCRNPHSNRSNQKWVIPHFSWMANKERPQARLFLASDHAYAPSSSADQDAGESEQLEVCCLEGQFANATLSSPPFEKISHPFKGLRSCVKLRLSCFGGVKPTNDLLSAGRCRPAAGDLSQSISTKERWNQRGQEISPPQSS